MKSRLLILMVLGLAVGVTGCSQSQQLEPSTGQPGTQTYTQTHTQTEEPTQTSPVVTTDGCTSCHTSKAILVALATDEVVSSEQTSGEG